MSRSGYSDYCDNIQLYRGAVEKAILGKRGQAFLAEMLDALDAMPEKALIADDLERQGQYCAMGTVGKARGIDMSKLDPHEPEAIAKAFNIANALAREIAYENDECVEWRVSVTETPEHRWKRMRAWVLLNLVTPE